MQSISNSSLASKIFNKILDKAEEKVVSSVTGAIAEKGAGMINGLFGEEVISEKDSEEAAKFLQGKYKDLKESLRTDDDTVQWCEGNDDVDANGKRIKDYNGRQMFRWENTTYNGFKDVFAHRGHMLTGEEMSRRIADRQAKGQKFTLQSFRDMVDVENPADNKGVLRLISSFGKLKLDRVDSWMGFRCNMNAEHNRQVKMLFMDAMKEDITGLLNPEGFQGRAADDELANCLRDSLKIIYEPRLQSVFKKIQETVVERRTENTLAVNGPNKRKVEALSQRFEAKQVAEIFQQYDNLFTNEAVGNLFGNVMDRLWGEVGLDSVASTEDRKAFLRKMFDLLKANGAEGVCPTINGTKIDSPEAFEKMIGELASGKSAKAIGSALTQVGAMMLKMKRLAVCETEVRNATTDVASFQPGKSHDALQLVLRDMKDVPGDDMQRAQRAETFIGRILPALQQSCVREAKKVGTTQEDVQGAFRERFTLSAIKNAYRSYCVHKADAEGIGLQADAHGLLLKTLKTKKELLLKEYEALPEKLDLNSGSSVDEHLRAVELGQGITRVTENIKWLENASKSGPKQDGGPDLPVDEGWKTVVNKAKEHKNVQARGKALDSWLDALYAQETFGVETTELQDLNACMDLAFKAQKADLDQVALYNVVDNASFQKLLGNLGDLLTSEEYMGRIQSKPLDKVVGDPNVTDEMRKDLLGGLLTSMVHAAGMKKCAEKLGRPVKWEDMTVTFKRRAEIVVRELHKRCDSLAADSIFNFGHVREVRATLMALRNQGILKKGEVDLYTGTFRESLRGEIKTKLFGEFANSLADVFGLDDDLDDDGFNAAVNERLQHFQERAKVLSDRLINKCLYLDFGFGPAENGAERPQSKFRNPQAIDGAFKDAMKKFLGGVQPTEVFSGDALSSAFSTAGADIWKKIVVERFAKSSGSVVLERIKSVKTTFAELFSSQQLVEITVADIDACKAQFEKEMKELLEKSSSYETNLVSEFDGQLAKRLPQLSASTSSLKDMGQYGEVALKALAKDVRRQLCAGVLKDELSAYVEIPSQVNGADNCGMQAQRLLSGFTDDQITDTISRIVEHLKTQLKDLGMQKTRKDDALQVLTANLKSQADVAIRKWATDRKQEVLAEAQVFVNRCIETYATPSFQGAFATFATTPLLFYYFRDEISEDKVGDQKYMMESIKRYCTRYLAGNKENSLQSKDEPTTFGERAHNIYEMAWMYLDKFPPWGRKAVKDSLIKEIASVSPKNKASGGKGVVVHDWQDITMRLTLDLDTNLVFRAESEAYDAALAKYGEVREELKSEIGKLCEQAKKLDGFEDDLKADDWKDSLLGDFNKWVEEDKDGLAAEMGKMFDFGRAQRSGRDCMEVARKAIEKMNEAKKRLLDGYKAKIDAVRKQISDFKSALDKAMFQEIKVDSQGNLQKTSSGITDDFGSLPEFTSYAKAPWFGGLLTEVEYWVVDEMKKTSAVYVKKCGFDKDTSPELVAKQNQDLRELVKAKAHALVSLCVESLAACEEELGKATWPSDLREFASGRKQAGYLEVLKDVVWRGLIEDHVVAVLSSVGVEHDGKLEGVTRTEEQNLVQKKIQGDAAKRMTDLYRKTVLEAIDAIDLGGKGAVKQFHDEAWEKLKNLDEAYGVSAATGLASAYRVNFDRTFMHYLSWGVKEFLNTVRDEQALSVDDSGRMKAVADIVGKMNSTLSLDFSEPVAQFEKLLGDPKTFGKSKLAEVARDVFGQLKGEATEQSAEGRAVTWLEEELAKNPADWDKTFRKYMMSEMGSCLADIFKAWGREIQSGGHFEQPYAEGFTANLVNQKLMANIELAGDRFKASLGQLFKYAVRQQDDLLKQEAFQKARLQQQEAFQKARLQQELIGLKEKIMSLKAASLKDNLSDEQVTKLAHAGYKVDGTVNDLLADYAGKEGERAARDEALKRLWGLIGDTNVNSQIDSLYKNLDNDGTMDEVGRQYRELAETIDLQKVVEGILNPPA